MSCENTLMSQMQMSCLKNTDDINVDAMSEKNTDVINVDVMSEKQ